MAGKESSQTVRLTLHLQDDVDGAILKEATSTLNELSQQGIDYEIADRHKVMLAPISDYREKMDININENKRR